MDEATLPFPSDAIRRQFDTLLEDTMGLEGDDLDAKLGQLPELPDDLQAVLTEIFKPDAKSAADPLEFAFRCGQAYAQLEAHLQNQLAANIDFLATDGTAGMELGKSDWGTLARFVAMRNKVLKTVADYTIKFLLVSALILMVGLSLGLI